MQIHDVKSLMRIEFPVSDRRDQKIRIPSTCHADSSLWVDSFRSPVWYEDGSIWLARTAVSRFHACRLLR